MKLKRILAAVLVGIMAMLCFASCGENTAITVKFKADCGNDDDIRFIINLDALEINQKNATVIDALALACEKVELDYKLSEDGLVDDIGAYKYRKDEATNTSYYWLFTVNGKEVEGLASEYILQDGDDVLFTYTAYTPKDSSTAE